MSLNRATAAALADRYKDILTKSFSKASEPMELGINLPGHLLGTKSMPSGAKFAESFGGSFDDTVGASFQLDRTKASKILNTMDDQLNAISSYGGHAPVPPVLLEDARTAAKRALIYAEEGDFGAIVSDPLARAGLEALVLLDGSRPSFWVKDGKVDYASSPTGDWQSTLDDQAADIEAALSCVGRIEWDSSPLDYEGTGLLVQEDLIFTNRHVLQRIAQPKADGTWEIRSDVYIDFGHEYAGADSVRRRRLVKVVFCGADYIDVDLIDHQKLDLALIQLDSAGSGAKPNCVMAIDASTTWASTGAWILAIGYPGRPGRPSDYQSSVLEKIFQSTYGYKRVAPGAVLKAPGLPAWSMAHDASTLSGSSGSPVLVVGRERIAAGLHYGGRKFDVNWAHVLGQTLDATSGCATDALRSVLSAYGVTFSDRKSG